MKKARCGWKRKRAAGKSANGYVLAPALFCLLVTAAVSAVILGRMESWMWLKRAQEKSVMELSLIDQAKGYWKQAQYKKLCTQEEPEPLYVTSIQEEEVYLELLDTAVRCTCRYGILMIYIDSGGITGSEWE